MKKLLRYRGFTDKNVFREDYSDYDDYIWGFDVIGSSSPVEVGLYVKTKGKDFQGLGNYPLIKDHNKEYFDGLIEQVSVGKEIMAGNLSITSTDLAKVLLSFPALNPHLIGYLTVVKEYDKYEGDKNV